MAEIIFSGGLNEQDDTQVKPEECTRGYNYELGQGNTHLRSRKPFDLKGTATNGDPIRGFIQLIKKDGTETTLVQAGNDVYLWDGASSFTSVGTVTDGLLRGVTWSLDGYSVIVDNESLDNNVVKKWDGTTFGDLTTGLGAALYARYAVVYLGRVWLLNVKAGTATPHLMVASAYQDPESYDTAKAAKDGSFSTGNEAFYMVTPDLQPINGAVVFFDTLLISTEGGRIFKLTGSDSTDFAWVPFYSGSAAIGTETMASVGNDIVYMRKGGVIESMAAVQSYGDVKTDDISRWIPTSIVGKTACITVYDQDRDKVYFFEEAGGEMLVLFKTLLDSGISPWGKYRTAHSSSFATKAAIYMRDPGTEDFFVFWGGGSGEIFRMEGVGDGDAGSEDIEIYRRSAYINQFDTEFNRVRGRVEYKRVADVDLLMKFEWADDYSITSCTVPLEGPPVGDPANYFGATAYFGGAFYFNSGFFFSRRISTKGFSPVGRGPGFYLSLSASTSQEIDILKIRDA
jgi:hypothetical protein